MLKLNKYGQTEEDNIIKLDKKIEELRIKHNLFIHGEWQVHNKEDREPVFVCSTTEVTLKKVLLGTVTQRNGFDEYKLEDLELEVL
jgi:hypothetical protein